MKILRSLLLVALAVGGLAVVSGCGWHHGRLIHHQPSYSDHQQSHHQPRHHGYR